MSGNWVTRKCEDETKISEISEFLNINRHLATLLVQRNIDTFDKAKAFFRPQMSHLHDPFLMKDMDTALSRVEKAINSKERILVFGDYDVDGTTAVSLMYLFLKEQGANVDFYIPDRYIEGYGISIKSIDYAAATGCSLVIVLDCGIKAVDNIEYAKTKGLDYIICDHHTPGDKIPNAVAVLDPKRSDCEYPFKDLSGCGVGFKLVQGYCKKHGILESNIHKYLDLVVISIASDIVPIVDENRVLAFYGLKLLNMKPRPGVEAILKYCNVNRVGDNPMAVLGRELTISDLIFLIGPRINASGRMETGNESVKLLVSETLTEADEYACKINGYNTKRKTLDTHITQEAYEMVKDIEGFEASKSIIMYSSSWHKGVIGIVASRLAETYNKPTIVFCLSNGLITGSARSTREYDIYTAINSCSDLLEHFGGHKFAAGLSMKQENLPEFKRRFTEYVNSTIEKHHLEFEIDVDLEVELNDITPKFYSILKQFAPFGPSNPVPIIKTSDVIDTGIARIVGKNHLKLSLAQPNVSSYPIDGIGFQLGEYLEYIRHGNLFDICFTIEENDWNSRKTLQLNIKDINPSLNDR